MPHPQPYFCSDSLSLSPDLILFTLHPHLQAGSKRPAEQQKQAPTPSKKPAPAAQPKPAATPQPAKAATPAAAAKPATPAAAKAAAAVVAKPEAATPGKAAAAKAETPGKAGELTSGKKNVRRWENGFEIEDVQMGECGAHGGPRRCMWLSLGRRMGALD